MGFSFANPKGPYDASAYTGVSFWAKLGSGSQKTLRLKVPDINTDPDGHVCTECLTTWCGFDPDRDVDEVHDSVRQDVSDGRLGRPAQAEHRQVEALRHAVAIQQPRPALRPLGRRRVVHRLSVIAAAS